MENRSDKEGGDRISLPFQFEGLERKASVVAAAVSH